ncbi:MAG: DUF1127 domain-containing protein [Hyphomicrobiales bacterium]|nr:DUF1127 domain-containing protein [Hyphomicrobiales bacterium]
MTATTLSRAVRPAATEPETVASMIVRRFRALRQRRYEHRAMRDLRGLSGHTLKDIGLHRSEITSIVCVDQTDRRRRYAGN